MSKICTVPVNMVYLVVTNRDHFMKSPENLDFCLPTWSNFVEINQKGIDIEIIILEDLPTRNWHTSVSVWGSCVTLQRFRGEGNFFKWPPNGLIFAPPPWNFFVCQGKPFFRCALGQWDLGASFDMRGTLLWPQDVFLRELKNSWGAILGPIWG